MAELAWLDDLLKAKNPDLVLAVPREEPPPQKKQSDIEILNSLFDTGAPKKGFNRVANTASTTQDINYLQSKREKDDDLWAQARNQLYQFFGSASGSLAVLKGKDVSSKDLQKMKTTELLDLLKHRDEALQEKAATVLASRISEPADPIERKNECETLIAAGGMRNLMALLSSTRPVIISETLRALSTIVNIPEYKEKFRQVGGFKPLAKLLTSSDLTTQLRVITCIHHLAGPEKNKDAFLLAGAIPSIVQLLINPNVKISVLAVVSLQTLSTDNAKVQDAIMQSKGLDPIIQLCNHANETVSLEAYKLLSNVSNSEVAQTEFPRNFIPTLVKFLKVEDVYANANARENRGPRHGKEENFQVQCLSILSNISQVESNAHIIDQLGTVDKYMNYVKPGGTIPFDVFKWNFDIILAVLRALAPQLEFKKSRQHFVEKDGAGIILKIMTLPEIFNKSIIEVAAQIMAQISKSEELQKFMVGAGLAHLIKTLQSSQANPALQLTIIQAIKNLAGNEQTRMTVFEEGGIQLLMGLLKTNKDDVLIETLGALAVLAADKFTRKVIRLVGLSNLIKALQSANENVQKPAALVLASIASEPEGVEAIMKDPEGGAIPSLLAMLEFGKYESAEAAVSAIEALCSQDEVKVAFIQSGGVRKTLELLNSHSETVQLKVIQLLTKLSKHPQCKNVLDGHGLGGILTAIKDHENIKKEGSVVIQAYRTLIITFKSAATGGGGGAATGLAASAQSYTQDADVDKILSKLTSAQLVALVNNLAKATNTNLREFLMKNKGATTPAQAAEPNYSVSAPSANSPHAPGPQTPARGASPQPGASANPAAANPSSGGPPPAITQVTGAAAGSYISKFFPGAAPKNLGQAPAAPTAGAGAGIRKHSEPAIGSNAAASAPPPPIAPKAPPRGPPPGPTAAPGGHAGNRKSVKNLKPLTKDGKASNVLDVKLKTVDVKVEKSSGGFDDKPSISLQAITAARNKLKITKKLLDQGVQEGRRFWDERTGDIAKWHQLFQSAVSLEKSFLKVLFEIIEILDFDMPWARAMKLLNSDTMDAHQLADALHNIGFGLKRSIFQTESGQTTEYEAVILPADFPTKLLLKAIIISTK